jgi:membrane-associated phospholipid phosphatase
MKDNALREYRHLVAEVVSWVFFPPLVGTVFFIFLVFWYSSDITEGLKWMILMSPFLLFIPLIFFAVSYKLGWVHDIDLSNREERPVFLLVFVLGLTAASAVLYFMNVPTKLFVYVFSGLIMTIVTSIITLNWKISFHTAATTSVVTAINILGGLRFAPFFLLIPIIAWARIVLKKHTFWQVVGGFVVALIITEAVFYLFGFPVFI